MAPTMRRLVLGLNAATVLLVLAGILLLLLPAQVPAGDGSPTVVSSTGALTGSATVPPAPDLTAADRFVRTDIFSARRSPPPRRYMLGDTGNEPDAPPPEMTAAAPLAGEAMDSTSASTAADAVPHLYGTMLGPVEATALLRLDARVSEPRLYRVGDRAGGFRVDQIAERSVTLVGPGGRVVLRLSRPDQ